jgi:predicted nuclease of predicted toxin-antitoxin system
MKLLFDQNLSPQLPRLLADLYPESVHIREVALRDADELGDLGTCQSSRICNRFEGLRFSAA